ncbi:MAG: cytochrome c3 family protein [Verrucomicrobia bacterium]|nr:cytochrome c3 family protein [Verrucomicrobiota bacterium]
MPISLNRKARLLGILWLMAWPAAALAADAEVAVAAKATKEIIPNDKCLECHSDQDLTKDLPDGKQVSLFVDEKVRQASVHAKVTCAECHPDLTAEHPDDAKVPKPVDCATCHEDQAKVYASSIHSTSRAGGASEAASCTSCHGTHDILSAGNPRSTTFKLHLSKTCGKCHNNPKITEEYLMRFPEVATHYEDSIHGLSLSQKGLIVAPSCNDCHGAHGIKRSVDRSAPVNKANIATTCGKCHVGIEEVYNQSVHGQLLAKGDGKGPVCTDCHTAHDIENPNSVHFKQVSDARCGKCHADSLVHYRDTYHGKAMELGRPNVASDVAACYDCHGIHNIQPVSNPASTLSTANIQGTCAKCHPGATVGFTQYVPHANPLDASKNPVLHVTFVLMTGLLLCVFTFFGAHTLLWLGRSVWIYRHDSRKYREIKFETQQDDEWFTRFTPFDRFLHLLVVTSFLLLVITGMPLKFYYTDWAKAIFDVIGGAASARALHRFGAIITFLYFVLHLCDLITTCWTNRAALRNPDTGKLELKRFFGAVFGPDSMVPTLADWREFIAHQKWFFGKGPKPMFDRWTYWEKFDYFAVFWGIFAIGVSGLVMWFPQFFTAFMPGWVINIALIVHSDEALLAAGFIFTVHFFNTHFRLEKFPMDNVIFSGRISKTEMLHERKLWYDRLMTSVRLDQYRVRDEWERWKGIARPLGFIFFGTGLVLLVLIIYAMVTRLVH